MQNTEYFSFIGRPSNSNDAMHMLKTGEALLIMTIPPDFTKNMIRHKNPAILFEDGSVDAFTNTKALATLPGIKLQTLSRFKPFAPTVNASPVPKDFSIILHRLYDPEHNVKYSGAPGIVGLVLMLTMLMITTIIPFRDIQGGTIDYLLVSSTRPIEIILAEIAPYIFIGYIQLAIGLLLSYYVFQVPCDGPVSLIFLCGFPYLMAELAVGLTVSTFCRTQFQAVQVINLIIALSFILSGFVFPINGMPQWAQYLGTLLPLTHFLKIIRGVMLRGSEFSDVIIQLKALILISLFMVMVAIVRFRKQFET
jgi:ABC-2 type transport system permease protein